MDFSNKKVLILDDNTLNLIAAERLMSSYGLQVSKSTSGADCEAKLISGEKYDLIFLDDMMPNMSGPQTLEVIKKIPGFNTKVIALTANTEDGMREEYKNQGFTDYLAKPIQRTDLENILNNNL